MKNEPFACVTLILVRVYHTMYIYLFTDAMMSIRVHGNIPSIRMPNNHYSNPTQAVQQYVLTAKSY